MAKIFIGIPVYRDIAPECLFTVNALLTNTRQAKVLPPSYIFNSSLVPVARETLVRQFLDTDASHLFFLDSDLMILKSDDYNALDRLLLHGVPIVGGVYVCKNPPFNPACMTYERWEKGNFYEDLTKVKAPFPVKFCSTGFLLIERFVLEHMKDPFRMIDWPEAKHTGQMPEDYSFCSRAWGERKIQSYIDPFIELGHAGSYFYSMKDFYGYCRHNLELNLGDKITE